MAMKPKTVATAPCQEVVLQGADIDLGRLPVQTCWPGEPAPLITWPLVVTRGPRPEGDRADDFNLGIYRMQIGRASCRESVCQSVSISVVAVSLKKKALKSAHPE